MHCILLCLFANSKDEAIDAFRQYKTEVENQLDKKIKMIRSDKGGEFESPFAEICLENRIIHQTLLPTLLCLMELQKEKTEL